MKKIFVLSMMLCTATPVFAGQDGIGLGVILGEPTGITFKIWTGSRTAIDAAAAWSFSENASFQFHADFLIEPFTMPKPQEVRGRISFYYGIGGRIKVKKTDNNLSRNENDDLLGIRFPLGFSHLLVSTPVEFFAEIVPVLDLAPDTDADLNAAVGARYYFK